MIDPVRRRFLTGGLCGCLGCALPAFGKQLPSDLLPLTGEGYRPRDADERGLWQSCERLEEELATSALLMQAPGLKAYTERVLGNLAGSVASDMRVYLVRDASFNASMFPTGMMLVHSGLIVRMRNEAQFAAVLGHESGHYFRKHSIQGYRDQRTKGAVMAFVGIAAGATGGLYALLGANSVNLMLLQSVTSFSRDQEAEADAYGLSLLARAGYEPSAASSVWQQFIEERQESAKAREKKYKDTSASALSTHPPTEQRMIDLRDSARSLAEGQPEDKYSTGTADWHQAVAPYMNELLSEQVKLNDPGASLYLVRNLAQDGWTGALRFQEGEIYRLRAADGDTARAAEAYAESVKQPDAPPDAWRAHGYALIKGGQGEEGRQALTRYLELAPEARDAALVRMSLQ